MNSQIIHGNAPGNCGGKQYCIECAVANSKDLQDKVDHIYTAWYYMANQKYCFSSVLSEVEAYVKEKRRLENNFDEALARILNPLVAKVVGSEDGVVKQRREARDLVVECAKHWRNENANCLKGSPPGDCDCDNCKFMDIIDQYEELLK